MGTANTRLGRPLGNLLHRKKRRAATRAYEVPPERQWRGLFFHYRYRGYTSRPWRRTQATQRGPPNNTQSRGTGSTGMGCKWIPRLASPAWLAQGSASSGDLGRRDIWITHRKKGAGCAAERQFGSLLILRKRAHLASVAQHRPASPIVAPLLVFLYRYRRSSVGSVPA